MASRRKAGQFECSTIPFSADSQCGKHFQYIGESKAWLLLLLLLQSGEIYKATPQAEMLLGSDTAADSLEFQGSSFPEDLFRDIIPS